MTKTLVVTTFTHNAIHIVYTVPTQANNVAMVHTHPQSYTMSL